jgi:hypothetical protein
MGVRMGTVERRGVLAVVAVSLVVCLVVGGCEADDRAAYERPEFPTITATVPAPSGWFGLDYPVPTLVEGPPDQPTVVEQGLIVLPPEEVSTHGYVVVVQNPTPYAVDAVVNVRFLDAQDNEVGLVRETLPLILPGESFPLGEGFNAKDATHLDVSFELYGWYELAPDVPTITVDSWTRTVDQFGGAEISGVLSSTFPASAYAAVSVLFRDQSGAPVYGASDSIAVEPGTTSFRFNSDEAVPPEWTATIFASPQGIYYY